MNLSNDPNVAARQLLYAFRQWFSGNGKFGFILIVLAIAAFLFFSPGIGITYTVNLDEVAVIQRFGKYIGIQEPGLRFKIPFGIDKKTNVKVRHTFSTEFGFRTEKPGVRSRYAPEAQYRDEALMLTGDLNVLLVPWVVQYKIGDPRSYLFNVRDVEGTLRDLAESTMRLVVGDRGINEVLTSRQEIATEATLQLQKALDAAKTGLKVTTIELQNTTVPKPVQASFNEVNQAEQEKKKMILQAREARNKVIPAALGDAEKIVKQAEGYAIGRINKARGDSSRFVALYNEYRKAKEVTRRRLYLETVGEIFPKLGSKHIIDEKNKGVLPLLNVNNRGGK